MPNFPEAVTCPVCGHSFNPDTVGAYGPDALIKRTCCTKPCARAYTVVLALDRLTQFLERESLSQPLVRR